MAFVQRPQVLGHRDRAALVEDLDDPHAVDGHEEEVPGRDARDADAPGIRGEHALRQNERATQPEDVARGQRAEHQSVSRVHEKSGHRERILHCEAE